MGCSSSALDGSDKNKTTTQNQTNAVDGAQTLSGLDDVCTAIPPAGYLNPMNQTFVAAIPTGRALLALLEPSYAGTYEPQGVPPGYSWNGSLAPTPVTIATHYDGGAVTCSQLQCSCDPPGPCGVDRCGGPYVTVAITQTVKTADGVFDETVPSTVSPTITERVDIAGEIQATELHGTYEISFGAADQVKLGFGLIAVGTAIQSGAVDEIGSTISGGGGAIRP
jgi:hypothetical protein